MVTIIPWSEDARDAWKELLRLSTIIPPGWTLIGAQMVALHGFEYTRSVPRYSLDLDILVNVRLLQDGTQKVSQILIDNGFTMTEITTDGRGHRFAIGSVVIDVLAPDGLGPRTSTATIPPARTVLVPGGTQALERTELVEVTMGGIAGRLPRPNLLGAILVKCHAVGVDDSPDDQLKDVAFLLSLVAKPRELAAQLGRGERGILQRREELLDAGHPAWNGISHSDDGRLALRILVSSGTANTTQEV